MELDLLSAARDLIAADSVSEHGNLAAIEVLEGVAATLGLTTERQEAMALGVRHANLLAYPRGSPARDGALLLVTHTDTVSTGPLELWTETDPFTLKHDGDQLFGLGVADVKLDSLAKLTALAAAPPAAAGHVAFLGTFAEEVGCLGARHFLAHRPFQPGAVSCGEPSELRIIDAHKGYLVARITAREPDVMPKGTRRIALTFTGKAAHSSTPHLGVSAIEKAFAFCDAEGLAIHAARGGDVTNKVPARCTVEVDLAPGLEARARAAGAEVSEGGSGRSCARVLAAARSVAGELSAILLRLEPRRDARFDPPTVVFNNGVVRAGDGQVELVCDARLLAGHDPEAIFADLDAAAARAGQRAGVEVEVGRDRSNPAMSLRPGSPLRDAAMEASRSLGLTPEPQAKPTNTEGGVFVSAGIDAIVFGPGRSTGNAHTANERQSLSQVREAARFYERLIALLAH